jgi:5'-deoxynucleotidase YfbR-like HD superfamily hydrolase
VDRSSHEEGLVMNAQERHERVIYARDAAAVLRCHTWIVNHRQNVGEHTHNVLSLYLILHPFPVMQTVMAIQFHDYSERHLGDVPAPAKWRYPALGEAYEETEKELLRDTGFHFRISPSEQAWLKACDAIEFMLYAETEMQMGNRRVEQRLRTIHSYIAENKNKWPKEIMEFYDDYMLGKINDVSRDLS